MKLNQWYSFELSDDGKDISSQNAINIDIDYLAVYLS